MGILKEGEAGVPLADLVRKHGISRGSYFNWRSKYAGTSVSELKRMKELESFLREVRERLQDSGFRLRSHFRTRVRPAKAGMFSGRESHRGKS